MQITLAELDARIRAVRDQEAILRYLLSGQTALIISPTEIPERIEHLGNDYQRVIIALNDLAGELSDRH